MFRKGDDAYPSVPVPPSLKHQPNDYEMKDFNHGGQQSRADTAPPITPYLSLQSRLSQIWFNRWTVLLLLVLVHFILTIGSLNSGLTDAKAKALSACTKVEDIGSAMASMPHYLSVGVNRLTASSITQAVHALMTILDMILTGIEQLILFVIGMMTDTYVCLITMVVHGGLNASAVAIEKTTDAINSAIDGIADGIQDNANQIQGAIDDIYGIINSALPDVEQATSAAAISDKMDDLKNIQIDTSGFVAGLNNLNDKIPTFDEVKNLTAQAVSFPFNLIREQLNNSYGDWAFNDTVFPVAQKEALSFCSGNNDISDFFDGLFELASKAKIIAIVLLSLLAVAACIPMAYMEIRRWRRQNTYARLFSKHSFDGMDVGYMYSRPMTARVGLAVSTKVSGKDPVREIMTRWCIAYATSLPAIFVLSLALAGFFSCLCQIILLRSIEKEVPALTAQVGQFADNVVGKLENVSTEWANDANGVINSFSSDVNDDVLGKVTNATSAVNDTLNTFMNEIDKGLNTAFGDTLFKDLAADVVRCLLGLKVEAVQKGLTWVHDHAHIDFPQFPTDVFSVGAKDSIDGDSDLTSFLSSPSSVTSDEITAAIAHVTDWLHNNIIQEALISTGLLLVYVVVVLMGVIRAMYVSINPPGGRGMGGLRTGGDYTPPTSPGRYRSKSDTSMSNTYLGVVPGGPVTQHSPAHTRSSSFAQFENEKR
ncbi:plasma membrane fusion protein PRM1 [Biscogniauxia mediterranea]|nr:plasma membrane fusion protein PRM1 [Biscogniauxia mediterranea]